MPNPTPKSKSAPVLRAALNRLIVAGRDEALALDTAARIVQGTERRRRLLHQALRRVVFQHDLSAAVVALGGTPAKAASYRARIGGLARAIRRLLAGPHEGDAYATCARATEKTSGVYARVLRTQLPANVRFGIEREFSEIEWDRRELGRLRFGARPTASPIRSPEPEEDLESRARLRLERSDDLALGTWSDEGGAGRSAATPA
ncbi:MAG TPA: hypothetical protein VJN18_12635 [Polyangiaceae bacterium]|nr:hypothetical protein [Polyangiaceae bacterium]